MAIKDYTSYFISDAKEWASSNKLPYLRLILYFYCLYIFIRQTFNKDYSSLFSGINLGVHELGHIVLFFMPTFIMVAAGTIIEILAPLSSIIIFLKQRDYFALTVSFAWLSTVFLDVSRYSADAKKQLLPLVSPFGRESIIHDWNYILSSLGILDIAPFVGFFFLLLSFLSGLFAIIWGGWILKLMFNRIFLR